MTKENSRPNKTIIDRPSNFGLSSTFFVADRTLMLMLRQQHTTLLEERIAHCQETIAIYDSNIKVCEEYEQACSTQLQEMKDCKKKFSAAREELLRINKEQELGDSPKSPNAIAVKFRCIRGPVALILVPGHQLFAEFTVQGDLIYLKVDLRKRALFCKLKVDGEVVHANVPMDALWCISKACEARDLHRTLEKLLAAHSLEFRINLLENLAKQGHIPNPYEGKLQFYQEEIKKLEGLIQDRELRISENQCEKQKHIDKKEEYETKLAAAQQQLAVIKHLFEPNPYPSNQTSVSQPLAEVVLKKQYYQLEVMQSDFSSLFGGRRGRRDRDGPSDEGNKYNFRQRQ